MAPLGRLLLAAGLLVLLVYISDAVPVAQEEHHEPEGRVVRSATLEDSPAISALGPSPLEGAPEVAGEDTSAGSREKRTPKKGGYGGGGYRRGGYGGGGHYGGGGGKGCCKKIG